MVSRGTRRTGRTNNAVEGWHRGVATNLGAYHPNFWRYLDILKREQCLSKAKLTQLISGQGPPAPRRQYRDAGARLLTVVNDYEHKCIILGEILGFCPPGILYPGMLSSMGFCPCGGLSPWAFVTLGFCLTWILSSWVFVFLGFCPLGYCPVGFCPLGFCPRTILDIGACYYVLVCINILVHFFSIISNEFIIGFWRVYDTNLPNNRRGTSSVTYGAPAVPCGK